MRKEKQRLKRKQKRRELHRASSISPYRRAAAGIHQAAVERIPAIFVATVTVHDDQCRQLAAMRLGQIQNGRHAKAELRLICDPLSDDVSKLLPYENTLLQGLFAGREQVKVSELKGKFRTTLQQTESQVVSDAMSRRLFTTNPTFARGGWS